MKHHSTQENNSSFTGALQALSESGFEGISDALEYRMNEMILAEITPTALSLKQSTLVQVS